MENTQIKKCKVCKINQPLTNYHKNRGKHYRTDCKSCRNKSRRKEPIGFNKLSSVQILDIKKRIADGQKKAPVGRIYGVMPATLYYWIKTGKI